MVPTTLAACAVLYQIRGTGLHGQRHTFEKPWFTSWESAAACWVSILIFWGLQSMECWSRKRNEAGSPTEPLLTSGDRDPHRFEEVSFLARCIVPQAACGLSSRNTATSFAAFPLRCICSSSHFLFHGMQTKQPEAPESNPVQQPEKSVATWKEVWALIVPGLFSVASIIVQGMGLRYISASLSLMLSGSCIIFTAVLSVLLLKCHLNYLHFSGELDHPLCLISAQTLNSRSCKCARYPRSQPARSLTSFLVAMQLKLSALLRTVRQTTGITFLKRPPLSTAAHVASCDRVMKPTASKSDAVYIIPPPKEAFKLDGLNRGKPSGNCKGRISVGRHCAELGWYSHCIGCKSGLARYSFSSPPPQQFSMAALFAGCFIRRFGKVRGDSRNCDGHYTDASVNADLGNAACGRRVCSSRQQHAPTAGSILRGLEKSCMHLKLAKLCLVLPSACLQSFQCFSACTLAMSRCLFKAFNGS